MGPKGFAQELAGAVQTGHDGANGALQECSDLLIAQAFDVSEHDDDAECFGQLLERLI
jgi:hypothetical protein